MIRSAALLAALACLTTALAPTAVAHRCVGDWEDCEGCPDDGREHVHSDSSGYAWCVTEGDTVYYVVYTVRDLIGDVVAPATDVLDGEIDTTA